MRERKFAHVNRVANIEMGNVHRDDIGQIARQTFDLERAKILLEQAAESLDALGDASRLERNIGLDHFVHRDGMKIDVQNIAAERRMLHFLHEREATGLLAIDLELNENVFTGGMTEQERNVALRDLQRLGLGLAAVDDRRHSALGLDFADCGPPRAGAPGCREFYLFSHGLGFLRRAVLDLEERRNGLVIMNPLDAFPEQLRDAKHRGGKTLHGANGHAVGRY